MGSLLMVSKHHSQGIWKVWGNLLQNSFRLLKISCLYSFNTEVSQFLCWLSVGAYFQLLEVTYIPWHMDPSISGQQWCIKCISHFSLLWLLPLVKGNCPYGIGVAKKFIRVSRDILYIVSPSFYFQTMCCFGSQVSLL